MKWVVGIFLMLTTFNSIGQEEVMHGEAEKFILRYRVNVPEEYQPIRFSEVDTIMELSEKGLELKTKLTEDFYKRFNNISIDSAQVEGKSYQNERETFLKELESIVSDHQVIKGYSIHHTFKQETKEEVILFKGEFIFNEKLELRETKVTEQNYIEKGT